MHKKNLWRSVIADTLALAMTLTPVGTAYANAAVPTETTTEISSTEDAPNEENTTEDSEWPVYALNADEDTTESPADTNDATTGIDELADTSKFSTVLSWAAKLISAV